MLIYLSGGFYGGWQDYARSLLAGHDFVDPRDWAHLGDPHAYAPRDLDGIDRCDAVLAYMEPQNPSGHGLCVELGYARARGRTIAMVDLMEGDPRERFFGMARAVSDAVFAGDDPLVALGSACAWLRAQAPDRRRRKRRI